MSSRRRNLDEHRGRDPYRCAARRRGRVLFAWLANGGYEANDAMIFTGLFGALMGAIAGAMVVILRCPR
jgi:hypothetical protein